MLIIIDKCSAYELNSNNHNNHNNKWTNNKWTLTSLSNHIVPLGPLSFGR
jgi:hypothetical protein